MRALGKRESRWRSEVAWGKVATRQGKKTSPILSGIVPSLTRVESGGLASRWPREFPILTSEVVWLSLTAPIVNV